MSGTSEVRWVMLYRTRERWNFSMRIVDGEDDQWACGDLGALDVNAPFEEADAALRPILSEAGYSGDVPWTHKPPNEWGANLTIDR